MAHYYVDPSDGGTDQGTEANPFLTMAQAVAVVAAGEVVYLRNTETLAATVTPTTAGSEAAGFVRWIGCPTGSWTPDGTTFKLNAADAVATGLSVDITHQWFENFEVYDSTGKGIDVTANGDYCGFVNVITRSNDAIGFDNAGQPSFMHKCVSYGNGTHGFGAGTGTRFYHLCTAYDNTDSGFVNTGSFNVFLRCIAHDNGASAGDAGFEVDLHNWVVNCVANGEVNGIECNDGLGIVMACRMTNNTNGLVISAAGDLSFYGYNVFHNSATADVDNSGAGVSTFPLTADSNKIDQDGEDGFNDQGAEDFNLKASMTYNGDGTDTVGMGVG